MRILAVSDKEDPVLASRLSSGGIDHPNVVISCGDLRPSYLDYVATVSNAPLLFVRGNHDRAGLLSKPGSFKAVADYMEIRVDGRMCCLSHYPMLDWNLANIHHGVDYRTSSLMLHGHIHSQARGYNADTAREGIWRYDVGVDANGYKPVAFEEIRDFIAKHDERILL